MKIYSGFCVFTNGSTVKTEVMVAIVANHITYQSMVCSYTTMFDLLYYHPCLIGLSNYLTDSYVAPVLWSAYSTPKFTIISTQWWGVHVCIYAAVVRSMRSWSVVVLSEDSYGDLYNSVLTKLYVKCHFCSIEFRYKIINVVLYCIQWPPLSTWMTSD